MTYATSALISFIVAIVNYMVEAQLGEWKKRRDASRPGVAILEALLEDVRTGIRVMTEIRDQLVAEDMVAEPIVYLPTSSWAGMPTIADDVLLRVLAVGPLAISETPDTYPISQIRTRCRNYFEHGCEHINAQLRLPLIPRNIRDAIRDALGVGNPEDSVIKNAHKTEDMLERARQALARNADQRWRPR
jgi:hypothetical protein